ncbi:MAG: B12-binding domain-containing radical SAM protein [Nitrospirae bacterium]|nr:B12-binding domain-containing radical SAM protein [Nitrospirota bacterium]
MKIVLLEHPRSIAPDRCNDIANTPLSSCLISGYVAGMLKSRGHDIEIIEGYLDRLSYAEIEDRIRTLKPDILGIHIVYHWQQDIALFNFLEKMKQLGQTSFITAYGFYATISPQAIMNNCAAIDSVIVGEAEGPFAELAEAINAKNSIFSVPGIAVRDVSCNSQFKKQTPIRDIDMVPFPVRTEALYRLPEVNILGSRGCYGRCTFCYVNAYHGKGIPWRGRSPENIEAEIKAIIAESGKRDFYFTDPNFFGPGQSGQERALRIAVLLKPMQIRFGIEGRVNDIHDETIAALVDAGLRHILIGLESGRDESLKRMNKMTTVAQNENALRILRKHGIEPNVGFIMFEPDATLQDIRINFEFLKRNDLLKNLAVTANVLYHHQIVLEGTEAFESLKREERLQLQSPGYEGSAGFRSPEVAVLSDIMRQVTNIIFSRMANIWSGRIIEPPGIQRRCSDINCIVVELFEYHLSALEAGKPFDAKQIALMVQAAEEEIDSSMHYSSTIL